MQLRACNALAAVSADPELGLKALAKGALESIVFYSLKTHPEHPGVIQAACIAIHWLVTSGGDGRVRAKSVLLVPLLTKLLSTSNDSAMFVVRARAQSRLAPPRLRCARPGVSRSQHQGSDYKSRPPPHTTTTHHHNIPPTHHHDICPRVRRGPRPTSSRI